MGGIEEKFKRLLSQRKKAFIPFFTAFYPSKEIFRELLFMADEAGVDCIEIGIPFSDPLADGKVIQYSSQWSLERNFSFSRFLEEMTLLRENLRPSLIIMSYFNPVLQMGIANFSEEIQDANIDGVIVPDLPYEESFVLKKALSSAGVDLIYLVAPTSQPQRIKKITKHSQGFIYLVSLAGVTGMRESLPENLVHYVKRVRAITSKPLCVGFGISTPYQAKKVADIADGVIVGSVLVNLLKGREQEKESLEDVRNFLRDMRKAITGDREQQADNSNRPKAQISMVKTDGE